MTLTTDETQTDTVYQATQHAMLIPWGRFGRYLHLSERLRVAIQLQRHKDAVPGGDLVLEFGLASLAGYEYLQDLSLGACPLTKDQAVADEWDIQFRHYTVLSRFLYALDEANVVGIEAALASVIQPYIDQAVHQVLCHQEKLTLCADLTGRPVSAYSVTYPPDAVFGYMANQLRRGHQALVVTLKGLQHRIHVAAFHHPGNVAASRCLHQSVEVSEKRLGCRPRRRTGLVRQRIAPLEAKIVHKTRWVRAQQSVIRQQIARQVRLDDQLRALQKQLPELETRYAGKLVRPHSKLAKARQQKARWECQRQSAHDQEIKAQKILSRHWQHLKQLMAERDALVGYLAELEADNATNPNPVQMRWLLDGGFGGADNVTYLIEMGYDLYTIANGQTTRALCTEIAADAQWTQVGARTQALDLKRHQLNNCPYPVRLTLLRWKEGDSFRYSTLISFSDTETLPMTELFPTYHQRQDVEAGIKQGKGTFCFAKLHVRAPAGIRLLGQFALFFWPNFVHWAAEWLKDQVGEDTDPLASVLRQVRTQVRVAANTSAILLTNDTGQMLEFSTDGPYAGLCIRLDLPFAYQLPMPLFKAGQQRWPVSSDSVKEQLSVLLAESDPMLFAGLWVAQPSSRLPEKVPKNRVFC
jgi:hypothetical protein